ncbi:sensor domain-containing protein [Mycobacterium sp. 1245499.0]|uniref:sensor domain-containing protein n=1 Tax=Mycobacterium sp. 1245499.0 TaxID=1834074 RepID=UPI0018D300D6|nr:sensor domain-containing protein [Mycobacterium sp. 1245499.0]
MPPPDRPPVNALATLSVVFAFVFAPVGAVLGHLGLRQIRRTGQRGRDRALVGTVLSYVVIAVVVGVLVVWLTRPDSSPRQSAAPSTTTTTTAHPTVAPPAVSPSDLPGLIPSLDDAKTITGDQTLAFDGEEHAPHQAEETLDRPECRGALEVAAPEAYKGNTLLGFYMPRYAKLGDPANVIAMDPAVAAFFDDATAQTQLQNLLSVFRQCGGTSVKADKPDKTFTFSVSRPTDVGNGITTLEITTPWALNVHAIAAKANVVMDLLVTYTGNGVDRARGTALDVANRILNRIPG